jgi:hypothetical protein
MESKYYDKMDSSRSKRGNSAALLILKGLCRTILFSILFLIAPRQLEIPSVSSRAIQDRAYRRRIKLKEENEKKLSP